MVNNVNPPVEQDAENKELKIEVGFNPKEPMSYEEAMNIHDEKYSEDNVNKRIDDMVENYKPTVMTKIDSLETLSQAVALLDSKHEREFMRRFFTLCSVTSKENAYKELAKFYHNSMALNFVNHVKNFEAKIVDKIKNKLLQKNSIILAF